LEPCNLSIGTKRERRHNNEDELTNDEVADEVEIAAEIARATESASNDAI
jgi:hypothetical protein